MFFTIAAEKREHIFLVGRICTDSSSSFFSSSVVTAAHSEFTLCFTPRKLPQQNGAFRNSTVQENRFRVSLIYNVLESTIPTTFALWLKRISSQSFKSTLFKNFCSLLETGRRDNYKNVAGSVNYTAYPVIVFLLALLFSRVSREGFDL